MSIPDESWRFGWGFFKLAMKKVPSIKWALGVVAIGTLPWIFIKFSGQPAIGLLLTFLTMIFLMVLLVLFARLATLPKRSFFKSAAFMVWSFTIIAVVVIASLYTSVFWCVPLDLSGVLLDARQEKPIEGGQGVPSTTDPATNQSAGPKPALTPQQPKTTTEVFRVGDTLGSNKILN